MFIRMGSCSQKRVKVSARDFFSETRSFKWINTQEFRRIIEPNDRNINGNCHFVKQGKLEVSKMLGVGDDGLIISLEIISTFITILLSRYTTTNYKGILKKICASSVKKHMQSYIEDSNDYFSYLCNTPHPPPPPTYIYSNNYYTLVIVDIPFFSNCEIVF